MSEKTVREQAFKALDEGNCVVLDGVIYTKYGSPETGARPASELPPEEFFAKGNAEATAKVFSDLVKEKADLEARIASLEGKGSKAEAKSESKVEVKKEDK